MAPQAHEAPQAEQVSAFFQKHRTGLVTLVFTDLVDSTALLQRLGDQAGTTFLKQRREIIRNKLGSNLEGEEIETAGDSFLLVFPKPSDAVRFALLVQAQLRSFSEASRLSVQERIGIHLGEVVIADGETEGKAKDLYGIQLTTAARVMSLAEGGQILLTRGVFDSARQVLKGEDISGVGSLSWVSHGPYVLKGVDEPVEVCEVVETGQRDLLAPKTSEKARRQVRPDEEPVLGWRPAVGQEVPNTQWLLEEKLGEGGFGEVWRARNRKTREDRVFKFCFRADRVRTLKRELTLFRVLREHVGDHPNIVRLHNVYLEESPYYLEEDYVDGKDLATWCADHGGVESIPLETKLEIVAQAAEALQAAHDAGIIHRDVKPGNILVAGGGGHGEPVRVKLTDFGIGQVVSAKVLVGVTRSGFTQTMLSSTSSHTGTHTYMAPELFAGKPASTRSDVYSLGVVLYQLVLGDLAHPVTTDWADSIPDSLLRDDLRHCFAGNPQDRFAAAAHLGRNLRSFPERQREANKREQLERHARQRQRVLRSSLSVAGLLLLLAVAMAYGLTRARAERDRARVYAYAADMKLADLAVKEGNLGQALNLLHRHRPQSGMRDLRGIEWRYLYQRCLGDQIKTLQGNGRVNSVAISSNAYWVATERAGRFGVLAVNDAQAVKDLGSAANGLARQHLAFDPTGRILATAAPDHVVLWDTRTWQRLRTLQCRNAVLDFAGDGSVLATFGEEGLLVWDMASWEKRAGPDRLLIGGDGDRAVALNGDGSLVAASLAKGVLMGQRREDEIALWRLAEGEQLLHETSPIRPLSIELSGDGAWLAVGTWSGNVHVWSVPGRRELTSLPAHQGMVFSLAFSPDGQHLASGGNDQQIRLWRPGTTNALFTLRGHLSEVWGLRFSADGQWLVSGSKDGSARLWRPSPSERKGTVFSVSPKKLVGRMTKDGSRLATVDPTDWTLEEWETDTGRCVRKTTIEQAERLGRLTGLDQQRRSFIASWPDLWSDVPVDTQQLCWASVASTEWALTAGSSDGWVYAWDRETGKIDYSKKVGNRPMIFFPGQSDLVGGVEIATSVPISGIRVVFWNLESGQQHGVIEDARFGPPLCYPVFPDRGWMAYPSTNRSVVLYDVRRRQRVLEVESVDGLNAMAFSPDGNLLAAGCEDGTALVWETATGRPALPPLVGHLSGIGKVQFSLDSRVLVTCSDDGTARMWNVATGQEMVSDLPMNELLRIHIWLRPLLGDGNGIVEAVAPNRLRILRLPTLAEIDATILQAGRE